jgi:hypothetical protein
VIRDGDRILVWRTMSEFESGVRLVPTGLLDLIQQAAG